MRGSWHGSLRVGAASALLAGCNLVFATDYRYGDEPAGVAGAPASTASGSGGGVAAGGGGRGGGGDGAGGCAPACDGRECGPDGCGSICGLCDEGYACDFESGACQRFCGYECGGDCGACPVDSLGGLYCTAAGICGCSSSCSADCAGKTCGHDGCGGTCGACGAGEACSYTPGAVPEWTCARFAGTDPAMSFFVTSRGTGADGGKLGGLDGADARCAHMAEEVGVFDKTWRAYLSVAGVAARDRIGNGPWINAKGQPIVDCGGDCLTALHTIGIAPELALTERGTLVDWDNAHDILTGTLADGMPSGFDCTGWTSNDPLVEATVGHVDLTAASWSSVHEQGCDQLSIRCRGAGLSYCFAE